MKVGSISQKNIKKFKITNNLGDDIPANLLDSNIVKKKSPKLKSAVAQKIPTWYDENISSGNRKNTSKISVKQSTSARKTDVQNTPNKRRKKKVECNAYDIESTTFQIKKSLSDCNKLKHVFGYEKLIGIKRGKEKSKDTRYLCSAFNCLTPVTLQTKSNNSTFLPLIKKNYATGDHKMSTEPNPDQANAENNPDEENQVVDQDVNENPTDPPVEGEGSPEGQQPPSEPTQIEPDQQPPSEPTQIEPDEPPLPEERTPDTDRPTPPLETTAETEQTPLTDTDQPPIAAIEENIVEKQGTGEGAADTKEPGDEIHQDGEQDPSETIPAKKPTDSPSIEKEMKKAPSPKQPSTVDRPSVESYAPYVSSAVMLGLETAKAEAAITTQEILGLKNKLVAFQEKEHLTPEDVEEMKKTQVELMEKLNKYDETSKYIAGLVGMANIPSSQLDMSLLPVPRKPALPKNDKTTTATVKEIVGIREKATVGPPVPGVTEVDDVYLERYSEELLPKIIVCGIGSIDKVPKIIVCDKKTETQKPQISPAYKEPQLSTIPGRSSSIKDQPLPVSQPVDRSRSPLREQTIGKPQTEQQVIENLNNKINTLHRDIQRLHEENIELHRQVAFSSQPPQPKICRRELYQKVKKTLPPFDNDQDTEQQLYGLGEEVKTMFKDLAEVQDKRCMLDSQLQFLSSSQQPRCKLMLPVKETQTDSEAEKDRKLKLMEEQCRKLNSDFNKKVTEMAILKSELDKTKKELEILREAKSETENLLQNSLQNIYKLEGEKNKLLHFKDQYEDMEQEASLAKQVYMSGQDELEQTRMITEDLTKQLDDYRRKYLHTLSTLEEQKKDMERKYIEHEQQVASEIQRTRLQLQETEEELKTNKYMLKESQQKLKETQQMHAIALNNINDLSQEVQNSKKEIEKLREALDKSNTRALEQKIYGLEEKLRFAEIRVEKMDLENQKLMAVLGRVEETARENERKLEEKIHETKLLQAQMETLREESARQISRSKGTFEVMKSSMQTQISQLEAELIQTRTVAYAAKQDKIAIQKKMQMQLTRLNSTVNEAQNEVESLQGQIMFLKGSYTNLPLQEKVTSPSSEGDLCSCPPECHNPPYLRPELLAAKKD